ncbi:MAG: MarR family transcriptional regulator [Spirochaetales bacterium]|nr:MarR family transcriptional regulator [Spirochaetales bacterium]
MSFDISEQVLRTIKQINRALDMHSKKLEKSFGLTGPQLMIVKELLQEPEGVVAGDLARRVSLSQATITTIIDRLEQKGIVKRVKSEVDKRRVYFQATEKASGCLVGNPSLIQENFIVNFNRLADWEQMLLLSSIQRIAHMIDAVDQDQDRFS